MAELATGKVQITEGQSASRDLAPELKRKIEKATGGKETLKRDAKGVLQLAKKKEAAKKQDAKEGIGDERRTQHGIERETPTGRVHTRVYDEPEQDDDDTTDQTLRKKGRPVGTGRKLGAKGPTGRSKLMKKSAIRENDIEIKDPGEYDQEGDMAKKQLSTAQDAAAELRSILDSDENLPEWVQSKITKAVDYLDTARDAVKSKRGEIEIDEKAVSVAQRRAAGIAHAAKKGDIPQSSLRGASKEMAKMPSGELKKFAKTKEKNLPAKKKEVDETTTSGSVATAPAAPKKSKGGVQFGKGIYDSMNRELESMIAESMSVNVSSSTESGSSVTVTATEEDAIKLAQILKMAGIGGLSDHEGAASCGSCGQAPCGCAKVVDENKPDWPTNTETSGDALQYSGGLNKPKAMTNPNADRVFNPLAAADMDDKTLNLGPGAKTNEAEDLGRLREMAGIKEAAKPDYIDIDKDGDEKEPMKKAAKDKEKVAEGGTGDAPIGKMSDKELADFTGMSLEAVRKDREHAEEVARDKNEDVKESANFESQLVNMSRLWKQYKG